MFCTSWMGVICFCSCLSCFHAVGNFIIPEVVRHPHFEVPYPQLKRGQQSLGALVAVVRPFRYIYAPICELVIWPRLRRAYHKHKTRIGCYWLNAYHIIKLFFSVIKFWVACVKPKYGFEIIDCIIHILVLFKFSQPSDLLRWQLNCNENKGTCLNKKIKIIDQITLMPCKKWHL